VRPIDHHSDRLPATKTTTGLLLRDRRTRRRGGPVHLGQFLTDTWLPLKRRQVRATTAYRDSWFVDRYINPAIGDIAPASATSRSSITRTLQNVGGTPVEFDVKTRTSRRDISRHPDQREVRDRCRVQRQ
jgi:hypothetical protein